MATSDIVVKLVLAVAVGGLIGAEREFRVGVGLRTMMVVCLGSTLFTIYSGVFAFGEGDPRRIAAAVVTGVGFLGAGMILRYRGGVLGLTTAATVWLVAALGMGIGIGEYFIVVLATFLSLFVLWVFPYFRRLTHARSTFTYDVVCNLDENKYDRLTAMLEDNDLSITNSMISKEDELMNCSWRVYGKPAQHEKVMIILLEDTEIKKFHVV